MPAAASDSAQLVPALQVGQKHKERLRRERTQEEIGSLIDGLT
jgi:hypothetical protein